MGRKFRFINQNFYPLKLCIWNIGYRYLKLTAAL